MTILVVTGTSTEVGKTVVCAALAALSLEREAPVAYVKVAQTGVDLGEPGDIDVVCKLSGLDRAATFLGGSYPDALSPAAAARVRNLPAPSMDSISALIWTLANDYRLVVVEGAGGLLVRFDEDGRTLADLAHGLGVPVLVVAAAGLGTLNHTALTLEALAHRGIELAGVVVGSWPARPQLVERSNVGDLEMLAARPLAGAMPARAGKLAPAGFRAAAKSGLEPALGGTFDAARFRTAHAVGPLRGGTR